MAELWSGNEMCDGRNRGITESRIRGRNDAQHYHIPLPISSAGDKNVGNLLQKNRCIECSNETGFNTDSFLGFSLVKRDRLCIFPHPD